MLYSYSLLCDSRVLQIDRALLNVGVWVMQVDLLCTHPMFGPDSGRGSWDGLNLMFEKVRIGGDVSRQHRVDNFLQVCIYICNCVHACICMGM